MKVTLDVDLTPEEARRFLGLPDLGKVHDAYVERMGQAMREGVTPEMLTDTMKSWAPMGDAGMQMWSAMLEGMKPKA